MATVMCALALFCAAPIARGSQVAEISVQWLADLAGQVVVGNVSAVRSYWAESPRRIETEVTLTRTEYAKGAHAGATESYSLIVPGGTVGDWTLRVSGAPEFTVGEKWMLFVLPTYKTHPVVGLYRGAFRIQIDAADVERVYDSGRKPMARIDARGMMVSAESRPPEAKWAGQHSSMPMQARAAVSVESVSAMTLSEFRAVIQPVLDQSRDHHLSGPAGKRDVVSHTPAALSMQGEREGDAHRELRGTSGAVPQRQVERVQEAAVKGQGRR